MLSKITFLILHIAQLASNLGACPASCPATPGPIPNPPHCDICATQAEICGNHCRSCSPNHLTTTPPPANCPPTTPTTEFSCAFVLAKRASTSRNGFHEKTVFDSYFAACKSGDLATVKAKIAAHPFLINHGNAENDANTCASTTTEQVFDFLIEHPNFDVNVKNAYDNSHIMMAAAMGFMTRVQKLIEKGDKMNAMRFIQVNPDGTCQTSFRSENALDYAIIHNQKTVADFLIGKGAKCYCLLTAGCMWHQSNEGLTHQYCPEGIAPLPQA